MTLNEKYRLYRNTSVKQYIKLLCVIAFISLIGFTFSAYNTKGTLNVNFDVAKFSIKVNGQQIQNSTTNLSNIKLITTDNSNDDVIRAGQEGYFDIEIDPTGTEVALEYEITFDFSKMPSAINMKSYSLIKNSVETNKGTLPATNKVNGNILLPSVNTSPLSSSDKVTYRVYWEWNGDVSQTGYQEIEMKNYELAAKVVVQQKIS